MSGQTILWSLRPLKGYPGIYTELYKSQILKNLLNWTSYNHILFISDIEARNAETEPNGTARQNDSDDGDVSGSG